MINIKRTFKNKEIDARINNDINNFVIGMESVVNDLESFPIITFGFGNEGFTDDVKDKVTKVIKWFKEKINAFINKIKDMYYKYRMYVNTKAKDPAEMVYLLRSSASKLAKANNDTDTVEMILKSKPSEYLDHVLGRIFGLFKERDLLPEMMAFAQLEPIIFDTVDLIEQCWKKVYASKDNDIDGLIDKLEDKFKEYDRVTGNVKSENITQSSYKRIIDDLLKINDKKFNKAVDINKKIFNEVNKVVGNTGESGVDINPFTILLKYIVKANALILTSFKVTELHHAIIEKEFATAEDKFKEGDKPDFEAEYRYISFFKNNG